MLVTSNNSFSLLNCLKFDRLGLQLLSPLQLAGLAFWNFTSGRRIIFWSNNAVLDRLPSKRLNNICYLHQALNVLHRDTQFVVPQQQLLLRVGQIAIFICKDVPQSKMVSRRTTRVPICKTIGALTAHQTGLPLIIVEG